MPGYILHQGSTILCAHGGQAQPTVVSTRVTISAQAICLQPNPHTIAGCPFTTASPQPCLTATWTTAAVRVTSMGMPVLLQTSQAICAPNGTPVNIVMTQIRVTAT